MPYGEHTPLLPNCATVSTLKRRVETGAVNDVTSLVNDLFLIFDNACRYNGEGTDYYKMAMTLKELVAQQKTAYMKWRADKGLGAEVVAETSGDDKAAGRRRRGR